MSDVIEESANTNGVNPEELGTREHEAYTVMEEMCRASGLDLQPAVRNVHEQYVEIELTGVDAGASFGRHGKSLDSLQYLANLIVGKRLGGDVRILLDAGGYRARRIETLTKLAHEYAAMVKERQEECELDPLPAHERRIVHSALVDDPDVRTYSEGEDPDRRIVIAPR